MITITGANDEDVDVNDNYDNDYYDIFIPILIITLMPKHLHVLE